MIDIDRTLRLLDVEAESNFVQAEAIDAINYLREENARLLEENDAYKMDGGSCANEVKRLREENARLREALKPFAEKAADVAPDDGSIGGCLCAPALLRSYFFNAAAAIREGGEE